MVTGKSLTFTKIFVNKGHKIATDLVSAAGYMIGPVNKENTTQRIVYIQQTEVCEIPDDKFVSR